MFQDAIWAAWSLPYVAQNGRMHPGEYDGKKGREYLQGFQSAYRTILINIYEFDICAGFKNRGNYSWRVTGRIAVCLSSLLKGGGGVLRPLFACFVVGFTRREIWLRL